MVTRLVFAGILVTVFVKMRNSGLKESAYGLWWYWIAFFGAPCSIPGRRSTWNR